MGTVPKQFVLLKFRKLSTLAFGLAIAGVLTACAQEREIDVQAKVARVQAVANGLIEADNARDLERVVELYAPDAMLLPPNESPVEGIAAIRPRYEEFFQTHEPVLIITIDETIVADDLAVVRGRTGGTIRGGSGVADRSINDVFVMILRQSGDKAWRISRLMWHATTEGG